MRCLTVNCQGHNMLSTTAIGLQGKQRLLYSLLDAMQSLTSQAVVIGVSCRLVRTDISHALIALWPSIYSDLSSCFEYECTMIRMAPSNS